MADTADCIRPGSPELPVAPAPDATFFKLSGDCTQVPDKVVVVDNVIQKNVDAKIQATIRSLQDIMGSDANDNDKKEKAKIDVINALKAGKEELGKVQTMLTRFSNTELVELHGLNFFTDFSSWDTLNGFAYDSHTDATNVDSHVSYYDRDLKKLDKSPILPDDPQTWIDRLKQLQKELNTAHSMLIHHKDKYNNSQQIYQSEKAKKMGVFLK